MSIAHIAGDPADVAEVVLVPGDPRRGERIARELLDDASCYSEVRGMTGFTGVWEGQRVSVQATGMGAPSAAIYATELLTRLGAKTIVRVGTCAALQDDIGVGDLVLPMSAASDSRVVAHWAGGAPCAPTASFGLLLAAHRAAEAQGWPAHVGPFASSDVLHGLDPEPLAYLAEMGVLGVDMETAAIYGAAARHGGSALSVLTVADHLATARGATTAERERGFERMATVALRAALAHERARGAPV